MLGTKKVCKRSKLALTMEQLKNVGRAEIKL